MSGNSLFDRALRDHRRRAPERGDAPALDMHEKEREVGAETYDVADADTLQPLDEDSWLRGGERQWGIPRGAEAWEARQLGTTAPMEIVKNTIVDQVTGGDLEFPSEEGGELPAAAVDLADAFGQVLSGPHLLGDDFDDLVTAAVSDMIDVGDAYWQCLAAENAAETVPVLALKPLDSLTMRMNVDTHGNWKDGEDEPAYYQAPYQSYGGDTIALVDADPAGLERDDVVALRWPGSRRSNRVYPRSPAMQVKQWLELLSNNTTHLNRFYSDNEIPAGVLSIPGVNQSNIDEVKADIEDASGDPRTAPAIGNEASWVEMGGTALDLNVIEEAKWFLKLVLAALGIPKSELGLAEDVNRNTASEFKTTIYKRVTLPLTTTIEQGVERQMMEQFSAYRDLGRPFGFSLNRSDPELERQRERDLRERWQADAISYNEYRRQLGEDPGDTTIEIDDDEIDFGPLPRKHGLELFRALGEGATIDVRDGA